MAHAPALRAAEALLRGPGAPGAGWASRVFFSDDGSTAVEVALKMGFRKYLADRGELREGGGGSGVAGGAPLVQNANIHLKVPAAASRCQRKHPPVRPALIQVALGPVLCHAVSCAC